MLQKMLAIFLALCVFAPALSLRAQTQLGVPVKLKGFVFEFPAPYQQMKTELGENLYDTSSVVEVSITPNTVFLDRKKKPLDRSFVRPGIEVEVQAERIGSVHTAKVVQVKTNLEEEKIEGYFERLDKTLPDGETAWISGQAVRLSPGVSIKGDNEWKNRSFSSFNEMMLGSHVEVKGSRRADGMFYAREGKTKPNMYTRADKTLRDRVREASAAYITLPAAGATNGKIGKNDVQFMYANAMMPAKGVLKSREGTNINIRADVYPPSRPGAPWRARVGQKEFDLQLSLPEYVSSIGNKLVPKHQRDLSDTDPAKIKFRFFVVKDNSFNAFALPDGTIVLNTGLLMQLRNEAQLASVLGHEIAHVTHEHARRNIERNQKIGFGVSLAAILTGEAALAQFVGALMSLEFSRDMEDEADRVGLFYLANSGYDPREAPLVWRQVMETQGQPTATQNFLYSGHSRPVNRLKNLNREIARNYYGTDLRQMEPGSESFLVHLGLAFGLLDLELPPAARPQSGNRIAPSKNETKPAGKTPASPVKKPKKP